MTGSSELVLLWSAAIASWSAACAAMMRLNSETVSKVFFNVIPRPHTRAAHTFDGLEQETRKTEQRAGAACTQRDRHGTWFSLARRELPELAQAGLRAGERHAVIRLPRAAPSRASTVAFAVRGSRLPLRGSAGLAMHEHDAPASRFSLRAVSRWDNLTAPRQWLIRYVSKSSQRTLRNSLHPQEITKSVDLAGNCDVSSFMGLQHFVNKPT
jgi:hypothetical protein